MTGGAAGAILSGIKVVDLTSNGTIRGSCVLGKFTPYRRP